MSAEWLKTASPEDIKLAIDLGYHMVEHVKNAIGERSNAPGVSNLAPPTQGKKGEDFVEEILRAHFNNVINVAKTPKSGDLTLYISHKKICVEVKNYTNPVPGSSVDKFVRDLGATNARGGAFISLTTPIVGVTGDFIIRYELTPGGVIPCVYIVSDNDATITTAINMLIQFIISYDNIKSELYSRDKVSSGVYELSNNIDNITRARLELQSNINDITNKLVKTTCTVLSAETNMRKSVETMRGELSYVKFDATEPTYVELMNNPMFAKQPADVHAGVKRVMFAIPKTNCDFIPAWKVSPRNCINLETNIGIYFKKSKVEIRIPRELLSAHDILYALNVFIKKVNIGEHVFVELDDTTIDWIEKIIIKPPGDETATPAATTATTPAATTPAVTPATTTTN